MAVFSLLQTMREQWRALPLSKPVNDVSSKTFMVTGSNAGLGFEASVHLAEMGPELLIATSRDDSKCERTRQSILEASGIPEAQIAALPLELGAFENVRTFVDRFVEQEEENGLDVLVANAGMVSPEYVQTVDGWEIMLQVNYLSTALLSILLLPCFHTAFQRGGTPRLVVVSSFGHYLASSTMKYSATWSNILETISGPKFASSSVRYNITKLLQVMFVRELAAHLPDPTPVVVCTVNPGWCHSELFRPWEDKWYTRWILCLAWKLLCARTAEEGSRTLVHAAVGGDAHAMHGRYLSSCQVVEESDFVLSPQGKAFSARLWDETITVLSRVDTRVSDIVSKYLRIDA